MKKTILIFITFQVFLVATAQATMLSEKYKKICKSEDATIAVMDVKTQKVLNASTILAEDNFTSEAFKAAEKNIKKIASRKSYVFGLSLRPIVLAYLENKYPEFNPTNHLLKADNYNQFGDAVAKYLPLEKIYEPFISFGLKSYSFKDTKELQKVTKANYTYVYSSVINGYTASVTIEEFMKAYTKIFKDPSFKKTKKLLLNNFDPDNDSIGGCEFLYRKYMKNPSKKNVNKSLILYSGQGGKDFIITVVLSDVKNTECISNENYLYNNFSKGLLNAAKN